MEDEGRPSFPLLFLFSILLGIGGPFPKDGFDGVGSIHPSHGKETKEGVDPDYPRVPLPLVGIDRDGIDPPSDGEGSGGKDAFEPHPTRG